MTIDFATLFTRLGKLFYAGDTIQTALETTIEDEVEDAVQAIGGSNAIEYEEIRNGILDGLRSLQSGCASALQSCVATPAQRLLIQAVEDDNVDTQESLDIALAELILQMGDNSETLEANVIDTTITYDADNTGNGVMILSTRRGDGLVNEYIIEEGVDGVFTSDVGLVGAAKVSELEYNWPEGSGASLTLSSIDASSGDNLVTTGDMETADDYATDLPSGWIASVATLGTTLNLTPVEVQTVTISATPTSGYYLLHFVGDDGKTQTTVPLTYNASGSAVQTALRSLVGLEQVTVATTGTSPNYTHTITFTGVTDPDQLTSTSALSPGAIAHATTVAGSAYVMRGGRSLEFDSNGSQLTTIQVQLTLDATTQYAVNFWAIADVVPAAGVVQVELIDGIGGTVIADDEGFRNTCHFSAASLTTSWQSLQDLLVAVKEIQSVAFSAVDASGGTFTLTYSGQTTAAIAYNASAATVEAALEALSNIGTNNVLCGGGPLPASAVTVTFQKDLEYRDVVAMTGTSSLTGPSSPYTIAVTVSAAGNPASAIFRTPTVMPNQVYLRIAYSTAISNGTSMYIDEVCCVKMTEVYTGGPYAALFTGPAEWEADDRITIEVENDRAGHMTEWCSRVWGLQGRGLVMPSTLSGNETRADSLIS